jgi:ABC-type multidrug transport system fused ATPase/permease subunit
VVAVLSLLLVSGANLATPLLIGRAIDEGIGPRRLGVIFVVVGWLVGLALARALFTFLQGYLAERASQGVAYDLRDALFERIERLSFSYYDRVQTGQLVTRLTSDVEQIRTFAGSGVVQLANAVVMLLGTTVLLLYLDWQLALVALAVVPIIAILLVRFVGRIRPLFREVQQTLGRLNTVLQEDLLGVRVIRAFAREDYETARYTAVNEELLQKNLITVRAFLQQLPVRVSVRQCGDARDHLVWRLAGYRRQALYRGSRRLQHPARLYALPDPNDRLPIGEHLPRRSLIPEGLRCPGCPPRRRGRPRRLHPPPAHLQGRLRRRLVSVPWQRA